ncbi:hypothetical protein [Streptomyces sp. NPDC056244]|uniref:hypothetical protein n=1 Tax=Streptomyces sp. NPDC056244 TaxID=3345762 RepID=UPI0035D6D1CF
MSAEDGASALREAAENLASQVAERLERDEEWRRIQEPFPINVRFRAAWPHDD